MVRTILISGLLLALFGVVGAGLVAFVFQGTAERIAANEEAAMLAEPARDTADEAYDNDILEDASRCPDPNCWAARACGLPRRSAASRWRGVHGHGTRTATAVPSACWWA
jgi:Tfp pilus assembly protein PilX